MESNLPAQGATLETVRARFLEWRRSKAKGAPIPAALWAAAVELCGRYRISAVARGLSLDAAALKDRVAQASGHAEPVPAFVSLPLAPARPSTTWVIEMENRHGERLGVQVTGETPVDLVELSRAFWGVRP